MQSTHSDNNIFTRYQYCFRALMCLAAASTLATQTTWSPIDPINTTVIIFLLIYTYLAYIIPRKIPDSFRDQSILGFEYLDSMLIGVILVLIDFSILPSTLFFAMIQFNGLLRGGLSKLFRDNIAAASGVMLTLIIHKPQWTFTSELSMSIASLIGIASYFCVAAYYASIQLKKAHASRSESQQAQDVYRKRTYTLSRYLPRAVWQSINDGKESKLSTERKLLTIFFSDIKDFSQLSEELEAEALTEILNTYLSEMSKIINHYGGTLDKFMGDGMMVFFGDDITKGAKQDAYNCLSMALAMRKKMKELQQVWNNQGIKRPLQIRMGINTGFCTVGTFGTSHHLDYTALGTHVNLASRLESAAQPGETLITYETWSLVKDLVMCRDKGEINVKGFHHPIKVYQVVNFRKELGGHQSYFEHDAEGFSLHLDLGRIKNYDKERILRALDEVHQALDDKVIV